MRRFVGSLACLLLAMVAPCAQAGPGDGTLFWGTGLWNQNDTGPFAVAVINGGAAEAAVTIEGVGGLLDAGTVPPGGATTFVFPAGAFQFPAPDVRSAAFLLRSDGPVAAYTFNTSRGTKSNDVSTLLPLPALGTRHRVLAWPEEREPDPLTTQYPGYVAVVGVAMEPTAVTILPTADLRGGGPVPATPVGTSLEVVLNRFEVLLVRTDLEGSDLSGSLVTSDRPVAVFTGTPCSYIPDGVKYCDHMEEQLSPERTWGSEVVALKSPPRGTESDIWRVVAGRDATVVSLDPDPVRGPVTLRAGEWFEFASRQDHLLTATGPIQVMQYLVGATDRGVRDRLGDPLMVSALPTRQFGRSLQLLTEQGFLEHHLSLVTRIGASVRLDGAPLAPAAFDEIAGSGWVRTSVPVAEGVHRVESSEPVAGYLHGYAEDNSYGYHLGGAFGTLETDITCEAVFSPPGPCDGGALVLDASRSAGSNPLEFLWSALSPGIVIADPDRATTQAVVSGASPVHVAVTVTDGAVSATCFLEIPPPPPPPDDPEGLSDPPWGVPLLVGKPAADPLSLRLTFEEPAGSGEVVNLYEGLLPLRASSPYSHEPVGCFERPSPIGTGVVERVLEPGPGGRYFLVSRSTCVEEGSRGRRSSGMERGPLPTDCGGW